jgi:hypothetical protein
MLYFNGSHQGVELVLPPQPDNPASMYPAMLLAPDLTLATAVWVIPPDKAWMIACDFPRPDGII